MMEMILRWGRLYKKTMRQQDRDSQFIAIQNVSQEKGAKNALNETIKKSFSFEGF